MEHKQQKIPLQEFTNVDEDKFRQEIYPMRKPVVLKGLDLGVCKTRWTVDYLSKTGGDREVKIHVSEVPQMDFIKKNFMYRTLPFDKFVNRAAENKHKEYFVSEGEKYYLRSLGEDPRKDVADISKQFPRLAADIQIPPFFDKDQFFSSVFRISSPGLQLWTHYDIYTSTSVPVTFIECLMDEKSFDLREQTEANEKLICERPEPREAKQLLWHSMKVMDNLLIQVTGKKRVVLFSPRDAPYLYLAGDKSEVLDVDNPDLEKYPLFPQARRYECLLEKGDVLFIPALWFHNTVAEEFGVGVNVFWKHLPSDSYDKTDTYGNKDPMAASRAVQILDRALKTLDELPEEYKDFYARKMVLRIQSKAYSNNFE